MRNLTRRPPRSAVVDDSYKHYIEDQLQALGAVELRRMFGGYGVYQDARFFGICHDQRLYFKTDAASRAEYAARGMQPFQPNPRQTLRSYYEVPAEVVEDSDLLAAWARRALGAASAAGHRRPIAAAKVR